ncbi:unnamed protein product [Psylliodes chrysocephalus]|uniref:Uncharacterized protein n=1 Tax=Psylliodes chrysocephalus TaxID=3402493 RepID=A0A9P0D234_9CUCU|nr:unnamed protein product [Psylliodes chrysocephala]
MSSLSKTDYLTLLNLNEINALLPQEMAQEYEEMSKEWCHLILNEKDFNLLAFAPNIKWYSICRCHLIADDGSTVHEHLHALIHFTNGSTMLAYKKKLQRTGTRLHSKTTFRKIICFDHAVGVLRYITCAKGQKPLRRDGDGLRGTPHSHYDRRVFKQDWLHSRGKQCCLVRTEISELASEGVKDLENYTSEHELHDKSTCRCDRGAEGIRRREKANEKRRQFYKTERGIEIRNNYKEKQIRKKKLITSLLKMGLNKKAELQRETILKLIDLL